MGSKLPVPIEEVEVEPKFKDGIEIRSFCVDTKSIDTIMKERINIYLSDNKMYRLKDTSVISSGPDFVRVVLTFKKKKLKSHKCADCIHYITKYDQPEFFGEPSFEYHKCDVDNSYVLTKYEEKRCENFERR